MSESLGFAFLRCLVAAFSGSVYKTKIKTELFVCPNDNGAAFLLEVLAIFPSLKLETFCVEIFCARSSTAEPSVSKVLLRPSASNLLHRKFSHPKVN